MSALPPGAEATTGVQARFPFADEVPPPPPVAPAAPTRNAASVERRRDKLRGYMHAAKDKPCADCGGEFPRVCMDFDHRDGVRKVGEVSALVLRTYAEAALVDEIRKCDVVCSNCHRIRTEARRLERRHTAGHRMGA